MLYAQDLTVGQKFSFGTYRMEEAEILEFAKHYDPLSIHIDPEAAAKGPFGGLIASGLHTLAVYQRLAAEALWSKVAGIAGKRFEVDLLRPVRPGFTLTGQVEIEAIAIRPERNDALVTFRAVVTDGTKPVMSLLLESLIHARPA